jgi:uncharacterized protein (DUF1778 family)
MAARKRNNSISFRVSDDEKKMIQIKVQSSGLTTSELILKKLLGNEDAVLNEIRKLFISFANMDMKINEFSCALNKQDKTVDYYDMIQMQKDIKNDLQQLLILQ